MIFNLAFKGLNTGHWPKIFETTWGFRLLSNHCCVIIHLISNYIQRSRIVDFQLCIILQDNTLNIFSLL